MTVFLRRAAASASSSVMLPALFFLLLLAAPAASALAETKEYILNNGLKVLLVESPKAPVVTVQIWYKVGSRNEVMGRAGLSHML
jgi:zinc protease